ncbi:hypothetical protein [Spongorhabdus nitratireducens]
MGQGTNDSGKDNSNNNVVDMFTRKPMAADEPQKIVRLAPELDGLEMLYSNDANPGKLFSMKILCWAMYRDGSIDAMVPWLNEIVPCQKLQDPLNGHWEGFFDPYNDHAFFEAPLHKVVELESSASYFKHDSTDPADIVQEIPDPIGTHAILTSDHFRSITLIHVTSWQLRANGDLLAMLADEKKVENTPVLMGDASLFAAQRHPDFKYFFHHVIANKIKHGDANTIEAFSKLLDN